MTIGTFENPYLILIPTSFEASFLLSEETISSILDPKASIKSVPLGGKFVRYGITGFGLAASGSGAAWAISKAGRSAETSSVILIGIAGTYRPEKHPVGSVAYANKIECVGIGVGSGAQHQGAAKMGWIQGLPRKVLPEVADSLEPFKPEILPLASGEFLSVTAASADITESQFRAAQFPDAVGEEMEGFAVGLACRNFGRPFAMIRGFSNNAGDRNKANWKIAEALSAVNKALLQMIDSFAEEAK